MPSGKKLLTLSLTLLFVWFLSSPVSAAIAFDATSGSTAVNGSSSLTYSHTCTGSNLLLFTHVTTGTSAAPSVTYNAVSMTQVDTANNSGYGAFLFVLPAPATGAHNVVVTLGSGTSIIGAVSTSYTGAQQSTTMDNSTVNTGGGLFSTIATTLTPVASGAWVVYGVSGSTPTNMTVITGCTLRTANNNGADTGQTGICDSDGIVSGATTMRMDSNGGVSFLSAVMASFAPSGGGGGTSCYKTLLAVGCNDLSEERDELWGAPRARKDDKHDENRRHPVKRMLF